MKRNRLYLKLVLLLAFICIGGSQISCGGGADMVECTVNQDCAQGEYCTSYGTCSGTQSCSSNANCNQGEECSDGFCVLPNG